VIILRNGRDPVADLAAQHLVGEAALFDVAAQLGHDPGQQRLRRQHAQRLVGRPAGLPVHPADPGARRARPAQRVDDRAGELGEGRGVAVAEQVGEDVAQRVDVDGTLVGVV
jgi:hypothetical protein